jgi:hypothetical protein
MESELVRINKIKNLQYVSFYDLSVPRKDGNITRNVLAPALMVKADGDTYNYSIADKYFVHYVHKVISVYRKEKKKVYLEGAVPSLIPDGIEFHDANSKKILEDARFLEGKEITGFYEDKDSYENSLLFQIDEVKSIMDIIRYVINDFSNFVDIKIKLSDKYAGYRNNYKIESEVNGLFTYLLVRYNKISDNDYQVTISNLNGACRPYVVDIQFLDNRINIVGKYQRLTIGSEFRVDETGGSYLKYSYSDGKQIFYDTGDLEEVDVPNKNLVNLDHDNELTWYKLPWDAYLGRTVLVDELDVTTKIQTNQIIYLDVIGDNFYKREYYTKKLTRDKTNTQNRIMLTVDALRKVTFGFKLNDDNYLIETSFKNALGDGEYQEKYINRFFYHLAKANDVNGIKKENLIPITKDIISDKNDLLREEKVKRIGEKK